MIVVDVETTGVNPTEDSIVSIGAIDFNLPQYQFYEECRIWEGAKISPEALAVNGFTPEAVTNPSKKSLEEILHLFVAWRTHFHDRTQAGENPAFDRDFLKASFQRYHMDCSLGHRTIDLHTVAYTTMLRKTRVIPLKDGRTNLNTDRIFHYVGLPPEPKPHHALTGAEMEAEAFSRFIYCKNLLSKFRSYHVPSYLVE